MASLTKHNRSETHRTCWTVKVTSFMKVARHQIGWVTRRGWNIIWTSEWSSSLYYTGCIFSWYWLHVSKTNHHINSETRRSTILKPRSGLTSAEWLAAIRRLKSGKGREMKLLLAFFSCAECRPMKSQIHDNHYFWQLAIKSGTGHHSQFLRCLDPWSQEAVVPGTNVDKHS